MNYQRVIFLSVTFLRVKFLRVIFLGVIFLSVLFLRVKNYAFLILRSHNFHYAQKCLRSRKTKTVVYTYAQWVLYVYVVQQNVYVVIADMVLVLVIVQR